MNKRKLRKAAGFTVGPTDWSREEVFDLATAEPDLVREWVTESLSRLDEEERLGIAERLVRVLANAGMRLGECLFLLGVPARTPGDLTAPGIAALMRYVRINEPKAMAAAAPVLSEVLTPYSRAVRVTRFARRAA
ncbi:MAG TPA: hypothetical protein VG778_06350 [Blastocatellia bacterium]|nr:hypothetical protein [Blastocatellia bacterium]